MNLVWGKCPCTKRSVSILKNQEIRSANIHSVFGPVINPCSHGDNIKRSAGGSSGGSAASVAMNMCTA